MIRSGTINTIHELSPQGKSIREIGRIVGIARNTAISLLRRAGFSTIAARFRYNSGYPHAALQVLPLA